MRHHEVENLNGGGNRFDLLIVQSMDGMKNYNNRPISDLVHVKLLT